MMNTLKRTASILLLAAFAFIALPDAAQAAPPNPAVPRISSISIETTRCMLVRWDRAAGAAGYQVYRAVSAKGKYARVAAVESDSYLDTRVRKNKTYFYKIRAVGNGAVPAYSKPSRQANMRMSTSRPVVKAKTQGDSEVKLSWRAVKGAVGYQVLTSTDKTTGFKKNAAGNRLTYTKDGLVTRTRYYFRVRAYTKKNGVTCYGLPSAVKNATPAMSQETRKTVNSLVRLVNEARQKEGRSKLKTDPVLTAMAQKRAREISVQFSHWRPDGSFYDSISAEYSFKKNLRNENLAMTGYNRNGPPEGIMRLWKVSPGHWATIMGKEHEYVSAGYYERGNYRHYVLLFASDE